MGATIAVIYIGGFVVSIIVHRTRAGIPFFARLRIFGPMFGWIMIHVFKTMFWPINLIVWFLRGRPGPHVVFGAKADRMLREQQQAAERQIAVGAGSAARAE